MSQAGFKSKHLTSANLYHLFVHLPTWQDGTSSLMDPNGRDTSAKSSYGYFKRHRSVARALTEPRYRIVLVMFLATLTVYVERTSFSIAYTALAKDAMVDEAVKGTVLSAFYWGYGVSQVPGGWAAHRYGGTITLALSFAAWSLASLLTPRTADSTSHVVAIRVVVGAAQGFVIPAVHTVLSQWIPPHERARAVSLTTSGMYLGSAVTMLLMPSIVRWFGPASLFKLVALLGFAWLGLWLLCGRDGPQRTNQIPVTHSKSTNSVEKLKAAHTPWGPLMTHTAVLAIVINNFTFHYSFYVVMNWLPTYLSSVLHAELASLGPIKTLPYLLIFVMSNVGGWLGDWLIISRNYRVGQARKAVNTAGFVIGAVALVGMAAAGGVYSGLCLTSLALGGLGLARGGFSVNHMDIAPKLAGVVMGISNTAGTLSGVIGVAVTGFILEYCGGSDQVLGWYIALSVAAFGCIAGLIFFAVFARGDRIFGS